MRGVILPTILSALLLGICVGCAQAHNGKTATPRAQPFRCYVGFSLVGIVPMELSAYLVSRHWG